MIVVAGESLFDLLVQADGEVAAAPGGGPFNTARALGRLGCRIAFLGRLSTDRFGRILAKQLAADGVDLQWAPTTPDPTLLAVAEIGADGAASYHFYTAGTAAPGLVPSDVPDGLPAGTTAFHVGTLGLVLEPIASTIDELVASAPAHVLVMADPNCRPSAIADPAAYRARLDRLLGRVDLVKVSTDDLGWLMPGAPPVDAARRLLAGRAMAALVTDGGRPVRIVTAGAVSEIPVPTVTIVDTVGAGDSFGAGFLAAWTAAGRGRADLADRQALAEATAFAVRVGALTSMRPGADPPTFAEVEAFDFGR
jgi:fructokinase